MEIAIIIIRNRLGEFFVHQRAKERRTYPNLFGLGAGGKVDMGEDPKMAAKRELFEEAGIQEDPKFLFVFDFNDGELKHRLNVFEVMTDQTIKPDDREWQWSGWLEKAKVDQLARSSMLCPDTAILYRMYIEFGVESAVQ